MKNEFLLDIELLQKSEVFDENYYKTLKTLSNLYKEKNELKKAIEVEKLKNHFIYLFYEKKPEIFHKEYFSSSELLSNYYLENKQYKKVIELGKKNLNIIENLYDIDKEIVYNYQTYYLETLRNLDISYYHDKQIKNSIETLKKSLSFIKNLIIKNEKTWYVNLYYCEALNGLASTYEKNKEYKKTLPLFEEYFKNFDFSEETDITFFTYAFIKYYLCMLRTGGNTDKLDILKNELIMVFKKNLGDNYEKIINEEHLAYFNFKEKNKDEDSLLKYELFEKLFK